MEPVLCADNLIVSLGTVGCLEVLPLRVNPGEIVALTGPSGYGKTTLLRGLARLTEPMAGSTSLMGKDPAEWGWPAYRRGLVYVDQRPEMHRGTVSEVLARPFRYRSAGEGAFPEAEARELLARTGLAGRWEDEASRMSEGERQRVALVRALLLRPHVLLLDEPTSALDEASEASVELLVRESIMAWGSGALVVTHKPEQCQRWCDRVIDLTISARRVPAAQGGSG